MAGGGEHRGLAERAEQHVGAAEPAAHHGAGARDEHEPLVAGGIGGDPVDADSAGEAPALGGLRVGEGEAGRRERASRRPRPTLSGRAGPGLAWTRATSASARSRAAFTYASSVS